jgi:hypothetical protein
MTGGPSERGLIGSCLQIEQGVFASRPAIQVVKPGHHSCRTTDLLLVIHTAIRSGGRNKLIFAWAADGPKATKRLAGVGSCPSMRLKRTAFDPTEPTMSIASDSTSAAVTRAQESCSATLGPDCPNSKPSGLDAPVGR